MQDVALNGKTLFNELAVPLLPVSQAVDLAEGANVIRLSARDLAGREALAEWTVTADWQPPALAVLGAERRADGWTVRARGSDRFGLARITVDGKPAAGSGEKQQDFEFVVPLSAPLPVQVEDLAGNSLIRLFSAETLSPLAQAGVPRYAARQPEGRPDAPIAAAPDEGDRLPPGLRIHTPLRTRVFNSEFLIEVTTTDRGGLKSVTVNGEDQLPDASRGCEQFHFARRCSLSPGTNVYQVVVTDRAGRTTREECVVVSQPPEYLDEEYRLRLGVSPVSTAREAEPVVDERAERVGRMMEHELLLFPPRFRVLERAEGWDALLEEQQLSASDLADPRAALRVGKLMPAELLAMTLLIPQGDGLTLFSRVVDTASGEILCAEDVYVPDPDRDLPDRVEGLVMKIEQQFPLMDGKITGAAGDIATVGIGALHGLKPGMRFLVLDWPGGSRGTLEESTVRRYSDQAVELRVSRVHAKKAQARVSPPGAAAGVAEGDVIYAR